MEQVDLETSGVASATFPEDLTEEKRSLSFIKKMIWLYMLLLFFEGGLRKWILPGLAGPLLLAREPITIWLLFQSMRYGVLKGNLYFRIILIATVLSFLFTLFVGHGSIGVDLFGASIYLLDFPLIFVFGAFLEYEDVVKIGKFIILLTIPMTIIIGLQYFTPQSSFINRGVGGDLSGAGFGATGAGEDVFRPSGTFSFTNGVTLFYSLAMGFVVFFLLTPKRINRIILIAASACIVLAVPLSLSRSVLAQLIVTLVFAMITVLRKPRLLASFVLSAIILAGLMPLLSHLSFFQTSTVNFLNRLNNANESEGGVKSILLDRVLGGMTGPLMDGADLPIFGRGLGMGTNAGAKMLTGNTGFLISEGEWGRIIGEMGIILGLMVILVRTVLAFQLLWSAFKSTLNGNILSWLLIASTFMLLLQAQWGQPTTLGFAVFSAGLVLASLKDPDLITENSEI